MLADILELAAPECIEKLLQERSTDELIVEIDAGRFLAEVARLWGVTTTELNKWIAADADRAERTQLARRNQAALWDWVGLQVLLHAPSNRVEILRAEKLAQHCRWRAVAFNQEDYGKKLKLSRGETINTRELTTGELEIIASGGVAPGQGLSPND